MKGIELTLRGNNIYLKNMFPEAIIKTDSLLLGDLNVDYLTGAIKSSPSLNENWKTWEILDMELEGEWNDWSLIVKLNVK